MDLFTVEEKHAIDMMVGRNVDGFLEKAELEEFVDLVETSTIDGKAVPVDVEHLYLLANVTLKKSNASGFTLSYWLGVTDKCNNFIQSTFSEELMLADAEGNYNGVAEFSEIVAHRMSQAFVCDMFESTCQSDDGTAFYFQMLKCGLDFLTKDGMFFDSDIFMKLSYDFVSDVWEGAEKRFEQFRNLSNGYYNPMLDWPDPSCFDQDPIYPDYYNQIPQYKPNSGFDPEIHDGVGFKENPNKLIF